MLSDNILSDNMLSSDVILPANKRVVNWSHVIW
jgi:hypothetical protein